jgi:hypothetical protein
MILNNNWRVSLARRVIEAYRESGKVSAALIGGSVALGVDDDFSDIDLFIFWAEPPSDAERHRAVLRSGGGVDIFWSDLPTEELLRQLLAEKNGQIGQVWPYESDEWSEHYFIGDVNIGISGFLDSTIPRYLMDLVQNNRPTDDRQMLLSTIRLGIPVSGIQLIDGWKQAAEEFPNLLAITLINRAIAYYDGWWACDMFVKRDERLILQALTSRMVDKIIRALFALNKMYLPDPRHKWLGYYANQMESKPAGLLTRLKSVSTADTVLAVREVQELFLETLDLVDGALPEAETGFAREWIHYRRPMNTQNPVDWSIE